MKTTRRDFIKITSMGAGGLAVATTPLLNWVPGFLKEDNELPDDGKLKRTPTYCEVCFWKCAGWTYTDKKGNIVKLVGNEEDQQSNGRLCPRGTGGLGMYYDKDRLKKPLIRRKGKRGESDYFEEASWEEALDLIAENMNRIKKEHGPECVALFSHGSGTSHFAHMLKAFGSTNIAAPSYAQCRGPREVGFDATFGESLGSPEPLDIRNTKCMVLIGSHLGENMHNGQVQEMSQAIENGATIITVDPRYSTAASKSKIWFPIKPATDLALLLAWIHVIIYEELYDKKYIEKYAYGFDLLKNHVKNFTPEWAATETGLDPNKIIEAAHEMGAAAPSVIVHPGRHVTWYGDDTQRSRAIAILNALLGSYGRRGGFYVAEKFKLPKYPHPPYPKPKRTWRDAFPGSYKLVHEVISSGVCEATIPNQMVRPEDTCNFKAWLVYGTNLLSSLPDINNTIEAIKHLEFIAVIDTMPMEITGWADVVLPEATYLERYDMLRVLKHRKPSVALRAPATKPLYDSKPGWWIAKQLGERLGLQDYFKFENIEEELDWQLKKIGSSLEEMKKVGVKTFDRTYDDLYYRDGEELEFGTNTGKIELYSTALAEEGYDPMPVYTKHPQPAPGYYRFIYGRAPMHTFGKTVNNPYLADLMEENSIWINPKVAKEWGLKNGKEIWLENQDGVVSTFPAKVRITERIRPDAVYVVHGFGHNNKGMGLKKSHGKGLNDTEMITNVMNDKISGGTGMRGNFVTFLLEKPEGKQKTV